MMVPRAARACVGVSRPAPDLLDSRFESLAASTSMESVSPLLVRQIDDGDRRFESGEVITVAGQEGEVVSCGCRGDL